MPLTGLEVCPVSFQEASIPPSKWNRSLLPVGSTVVALTITRRATAAPRTFRKVGAFPAMHELQTKSPVDLLRVVLEVDLVQRQRPIRLD